MKIFAIIVTAIIVHAAAVPAERDYHELVDREFHELSKRVSCSTLPADCGNFCP